MKFKAILSLTAVLAPVLPVQAQDTVAFSDSITSIIEEINASGNIRVEQPVLLDSLLRKKIEQGLSEDNPAMSENRQSNVRSGYRIQVYDDNNPRTAASQAKYYGRQMESMFPQYRTYVTFNSPYWNVKVGDFRTRGEADAAMDIIRENCPQFGSYLRIVRDRINISD